MCHVSSSPIFADVLQKRPALYNMLQKTPALCNMLPKRPVVYNMLQKKPVVYNMLQKRPALPKQIEILSAGIRLMVGQCLGFMRFLRIQFLRFVKQLIHESCHIGDMTHN